MDLALRFAAEAEARGVRVLALKGVSIAEELYGSIDQRPMADIDFLVVDTQGFEEAVRLARHMGLVETGASDHALVFKEPASGVILELHISLTACPGLFSIDHEALWRRRAAVTSSPSIARLGNADLVTHLALHTAFQHGFAANAFHYGDFVRAIERWRPLASTFTESSRSAGAHTAIAAMARACSKRFPDSGLVRDLAHDVSAQCPAALGRWIDAWPEMPPRASVTALAFVRFQLAPSKGRYIAHSLFPAVIPGRTTPRSHAMRRILNVIDAGWTLPVKRNPL